MWIPRRADGDVSGGVRWGLVLSTSDVGRRASGVAPHPAFGHLLPAGAGRRVSMGDAARADVKIGASRRTAGRRTPDDALALSESSSTSPRHAGSTRGP